MRETILDKIVATKRGEVAALRMRTSAGALAEQAAAAPVARDFYAAVVGDAPRGQPVKLIAELKRSSPSAGLIRPDFDPVAIAAAYEKAGAAALSVLTDQTYFGGELSYIELVKSASRLPVLRKDFIVDPLQVCESRAAGADAILLIAAVLEKERIAECIDLAVGFGMATLLEVHDADELKRALPFVQPARRVILGINNRDLRAQKTDLGVTVRLAAELPPATAFVAESGISTRRDALAMAQAGACAVLVGEALLREADVARAARALLSDDAC